MKQRRATGRVQLSGRGIVPLGLESNYSAGNGFCTGGLPAFSFCIRNVISKYIFRGRAIFFRPFNAKLMMKLIVGGCKFERDVRRKNRNENWWKECCSRISTNFWTTYIRSEFRRIPSGFRGLKIFLDESQRFRESFVRVSGVLGRVSRARKFRRETSKSSISTTF